MKLDLHATLCLLFCEIVVSGCIPKKDIYNNTYILEKRISWELEKLYEKRRDFFEVKVSDFSIIEKKNRESICKAKIYYKISDSYLFEYNQMLKLGKSVNLSFKEMNKYELINYDMVKNSSSDENIVFSIVSDPKKGGNCLVFHHKISEILLVRIFDTNLFRDFTNLNRPLLDRSKSKTSTNQIDVVNIKNYLRGKGFSYDSRNEAYSNGDSCLKIVSNDTKTLFILDSPRVFSFLEHPTTYSLSKGFLANPQIFEFPKIPLQKKRKH